MAEVKPVKDTLLRRIRCNKYLQGLVYHAGQIMGTWQHTRDPSETALQPSGTSELMCNLKAGLSLRVPEMLNAD